MPTMEGEHSQTTNDIMTKNNNSWCSLRLQIKPSEKERFDGVFLPFLAVDSLIMHIFRLSCH
jgi:hypothetical protein